MAQEKETTRLRPEETLFKLLLEKGVTLAVAESCSGGLLAHRLTNVPGISEVFLLGVVSYSNTSKIRVLGVDTWTLKAKGPVSPDVALQMSMGVQRLSGSSLSLGITGIAGPGGGTKLKPVGTVYMGLYIPGMGLTKTRHFLFQGERNAVKAQAAEAGLRWMCHVLDSEFSFRGHGHQEV